MYTENASIDDSEEQKEKEAEVQVELVRVIPNKADPVNDITDGVWLEDVCKAFVPDEVVDVVSDPMIQSTVGGLGLGVLAGAADDAVNGAAVGSVIGDLRVTLGIAVTFTVGAAVAA